MGSVICARLLAELGRPSLSQDHWKQNNAVDQRDKILTNRTAAKLSGDIWRS
jgi:hypothetical protein